MGLHAFEGIASAASEPQILFASGTASSVGNQVIKLHGHPEQRFATEAVATSVTSSLPYAAAERYRNITAIGRAHWSVAVIWLSSASVGTRLPRKRIRTAARALRNITRSASRCKIASCPLHP